MKPLISIIFCLLVFTSFSCKKAVKGVNPLDFNCDKKAKIAFQSFGSLNMSISYENGKIAKITQIYSNSNGRGLVENYNYNSPNELIVTQNSSDKNEVDTLKITLNDKGYVIKIIQEGAAGYINTYTYDADGFVKTTVYTYPNYPFMNSISTYTYSNGNLIQVKNAYQDTIKFTIDYTYYEDKLNKADLIATQNQPDMYGKLSKNLVKKINYTYANKTTSSYEYTYEQNSNGFVKSLVEILTDQYGESTTKINKYEYICP